MDPNVERGMAKLDTVKSDWKLRINLDRLNMRSSCDCIVGQIGDGDYRTGLCRIFSVRHFAEVSREDQVAHGFEIEDVDNPHEAFENLTSDWTVAINAAS